MRKRIRRNCAEKKIKICVQKKQKKSEPDFEHGISNLKSATLTTWLPGLTNESQKYINYINTAGQI